MSVGLVWALDCMPAVEYEPTWGLVTTDHSTWIGDVRIAIYPPIVRINEFVLPKFNGEK